MVKVKNMESYNGNKVANQFLITDYEEGSVTFQSYDTVIAVDQCGYYTLDTNALEYSRTTSKYLYLFMGMNKKEIEEGIKRGIITVKDLN